MKTHIVISLLLVLTLAACGPDVVVTSTIPPVPETPVPLETVVPSDVPPTEEEPSSGWQTYTNSAFGLGFQYPAGWLGPSEDISDQSLRVEVGSDVVYPYGTDRLDQIYTVKNAYYILVQYSMNDQNQYWREVIGTLLNLQDGQALEEGRGVTIRVRQLTLGRFQGYEYISTLSYSAQTEPVYSRQVILYDENSNLLLITGTPNNVQVGAEGWRVAYEMVDQMNLTLFYQIVESFTFE